MASKRRIGIVGYGHLGQYLVEEILKHDAYDLAFVWNRTPCLLEETVPKDLILNNLINFKDKRPDLIIEVAHPSIVQNYGAIFLADADFMVGSPTAFANQDTEKELKNAATKHGCYISSGAFWGGEDIMKMADMGTLQALKITMTKHPTSFKLSSELKEKNDQVEDEKYVLYDGPVRELCPKAPNNVNTMAVAAISAHNLGFDKVQGCLISDPTLLGWHLVQIDAWGPGDVEHEQAFHVQTKRMNPAQEGMVTGNATFTSFLSSMFKAVGKGPGIHLC